MNNKFAANAIKKFRALPLPAKIIISVISLGVILNLVSRYNQYQYNQEITTHQQIVDVEKVPAAVKEFLSNENIQRMDGNGMNIYTGENPPNVEGTYLFKHMVIKYDLNGNIFSISPSSYTFKDQKDDDTIVLSVKGKEGNKYQEDGKGVIISGEGNCFSVYLDSSSSVGECRHKSVDIFSACKDTKKDGLVNMDLGTLWTYRGDKCPADEYVPAGYIRIFSQKSLAPRVK